ncbi:hypothetical protein QL285_087924 [Trifolium repens]|nr:hypothetical protein QL285_087924 [Trifolium repens]
MVTSTLCQLLTVGIGFKLLKTKRTGKLWVLWKKWDFGKTEPVFCVSATLAWRAEELATASLSGAAACVFCFCEYLSNSKAGVQDKASLSGRQVNWSKDQDGADDWSEPWIIILDDFSLSLFYWGVIIGIRAGRSSIGPCHESEQPFPKQYRPFGSGLFTLKPSRAESDQHRIVYVADGATGVSCVTQDRSKGCSLKESKYALKTEVRSAQQYSTDTVCQRTGKLWVLWKKWDFGKTEPVFCVSATLAWRAEELATASLSGAAACVFCFCEYLSNSKKLDAVAELVCKIKLHYQVDRLTGARTRMELMIGASLGSSY